MDSLWQNIVIGLAVAAAVIYLVAYFIRRRRHRADICDKCLERLSCADRKDDSESQS